MVLKHVADVGRAYTARAPPSSLLPPTRSAWTRMTLKRRTPSIPCVKLILDDGVHGGEPLLQVTLHPRESVTVRLTPSSSVEDADALLLYRSGGVV